MEQTLGKRIVNNRKRLCLTQDQLAEHLGVTAQAVSKWENDQSCPDISMLPKLADIFGISTDELLGMTPPKQEPVHQAEIVTEDNTCSSDSENKWELQYNIGSKGGMGVAIWILLTGGLLLAANLLHWNTGLWDIAWPAGLLVFGLFGLFPKFSFFRLGCGLLGIYCLLRNLNYMPLVIDSGLLLPICLLLFGMSLLVDSIRKRKKPTFTVSRNGKHIFTRDSSEDFQTSYTVDGERFHAATSFGENHHFVQLPRLSGGEASVSFGELSIDLSGCEALSDGCRLQASCSFGDLEILVPRRWRVEHDSKTAFSSVAVDGQPDPDAAQVIYLECSANFGNIQIRYI